MPTHKTHFHFFCSHTKPTRKKNERVFSPTLYSASQPILSLNLLTFAPLKKLISISLLFVFLSANTELHQLLKLPVLIHHYLSHHQDEHDKSFAHFLADHYSSKPEHTDKDNHEHDNLPFKTNDCADMHSNIAFNHHHHFSLCEPNIVAEKVSVIYNVLFYSSSALNSIWQPPKIS